MEETMELISVLAVEEFETPRVQISIDVRNEKMVSLFRKLIAYYKPEIAMSILSELAWEIVSTHPDCIANMSGKEKDINTKQSYIK